MDWLKDEIGLTEGDEAEREKMYELFEKAAKDYICKPGSVSAKCLNEQFVQLFHLFIYLFIYSPIWQPER